MNKQAELTRWTPKRLLSLLMALIMTLSLLPTAAFAAEGDTIVLSAAHWDESNKTQQLSSYTYSDSDSSNHDLGFFLGIGFDNFTPSTNLYPGAVVEIPFKCNYTGTLNPPKITFTFKDLNSPHGTSIEDSATMFHNGHTGTLSASVGGDGSLRFTVQSSYTLANGTSGSSDLVTVQIKELVPASTWQVKFHMNDGTDAIYSSVPVQGGYGTTRPSDPTREGYKFAGWYTEANSGSPYDFGAPVTADTNVYAHWTADGTTQAGSHTVNFLPGAADAYIPFVATATVKDGTNYTIPTNKPTREGYTFEGWSDGTNTYQAGDKITNVTTDIVLSAKWTATPVTIKIVNQSEKLGVTVTPLSHSPSVGQSAYFSVAVPPKYDVAKMFVFAGITDGEHEYLVPESQHIDDKTGNVIFYYNFNVKEGMTHRDKNTDELTTVFAVGPVTVKTFNVTLPTGAGFDAKFTDPAGADDAKFATVNYDGTVSFTVKARPGYTVEGVYANGVKLDPDTSTTDTYTIKNIKANQAVMVDMAAVQFHTVTYVLDGKQMAAQSVQDNTTLTPPSAPNKTGYNWDGKWYTKEDYSDPFTGAVTENLILYGRYTPKDVTISYDLNGGSWPGGTAPASVTKTYGLAATLTEIIPTKDGCTFLGWSESDTATAASYLPGATFSKEIDRNITLYAVWQKNTYTITFSSGEGYSLHSIGSMTVAHGENFEFNLFVDPAYAQNTPTVYVNTGSIDADKLNPDSVGSDAPTGDGAKVYHYTLKNVTANTAINAEVTTNATYTVTFMTGTDVYQTQQVEFNHKATQPVDPKVEGFTFDGWYKDPGCADADKWNFATPITSDTMLYAKLTPITPKITWVSPATGYTIAVEGTKKDETAPSPLASGNMVVYGSTVTFTIEILDGYDASQMQVGINNVLHAPKSKSEDGKTYTFEFTAKEDTKITVTGIERKTVTIIYNANARDDVSGLPSPQVVKYYLAALGETGNDKITTQVPSRTGYTFLGWSIHSDAPAADTGYDAATIKSPTGATAKFTENTTLYAVWKAVDTTVSLKVTDVAATDTDTTTTPATTRYLQYEGEKITLQATLNVGAKGTIEFYKAATSSAAGTKIGSTTVNGETAELSVKVGEYKTTAKDEYYYAIFKSEADEGYAGSTSAVANVGILSKAIRWSADTDASELLVYKGNGATGTPITDPMIAGQTYTLKVKTDKITGVETLDSKQPVLGKDYKIVWQYYEVDKNDWTTVTESSDKDTYLVTGKYSGYQFRAQIVPLGPTNGSKFIKAAKYDAAGLVNDQYDTCLYTTPTDATALQATTTALEITGADNEENDVYINGTQPFNATAGSHLAQFEGQKVTLTATVTDTTTGTPAVTTGFVNFYRKGATDTLLNASPIAVGTNGVATCEVTISNWDTTQTAANNKDEFYAVYLANATYDTSASWTAATAGSTATGKLEAVYIKSTTIQTPIIESTLANDAGDKATTYNDNLTGLLAGVKHTFTLRQTGAAATADNQFSVVAKDGRTVEAKNYDIEWQYKTTGNFAKADNDSTAAIYTTKTTKFGDQYRVVLNAKGDMTVGATSKVAEIGKKQDVTVTVEASADWVYQLNEITLTATVAAKETTSTMKPTGTVAFYYSVDNGTTWTKIGDAKDLAEVAGVMTASIQTDQLPVKAGDNTKQNVEITTVYEGNETFEKSATATATGASHTIAATPNCTTTNKDVTVYSSVVYVDSAENTTSTPGAHGIAITAEDGKVLANETNVNLKLSEVYTLDHATDAADKAHLAHGTDYTVQWQKLTNAAAYPDKASATWENITSATGTTCQIDVEPGAAYRAVITVKDTPIAKGSYDEVHQAIPGRKVYYSNILVAANAPATLTVNVNTDNTSKGYEGIVEGETVTIHTFTSGATGTTPISQLTVNIYPGKPAEVAAATTPVAPVFTAEKANVNGHVSFDWNKDVTPGYYTLKVKATFTNGYDDKEITRTLIVRDNDYKFELGGDNAVYNGKVQGLNVAVQNMGIENALAQKSVVVYYYTDEARTQQVEPTQAGTYYATVRLQESAYWTEKTLETTFTIKPRPVEVVDLVAQAKVYDGTNNANIQEIILNDSAVNSDGTATGDKGIIDGDSVYAVGTGYTSKDTAGTDATLGVKDVSLKGDDAANYTLSASGYTEVFNIQRSQVKGAIVSGRTYKYTGKDIKLAASDIYLIDQAGNQLTNYDVTYYYHNGDGVEKVDAMNKMGKYTVIARPEQNNYKGGATETVYVGTADNAGTLDKNAVSSLITISNTVELYGATTGVTVSATKGTATASYYYDGAWKDTAPTAAGRYLVKATVTNDSVTDTAYGIYTIVKARPEFTPTTKPSMEYTSGRYDGTVDAGFVSSKSDSTAETYITYTGGTIQGVAYEAPTEVGKYIATVHVGETANYTAHEKQVAFEITPKALTITADSISRQQYGAYPDLTASFNGLATGGVAADTSLRDVQIQPELIDDSNYTNDASDQVGNNYSITAVAALARNYDVSYVKGNMSVTHEDPKPYLEIRGMIENGDGATDLAYYGDVIQLYAYGNQSKTTGVYNTSSVLAWSVTGPATITDGLLTVTGVGDVTVTLKRGIGAQQISTSLTFEAKKQEVKVVVPAEDKVYDGTIQDYTSTKTLSAVNAMGIKVFSGNPRFVITNNTRSDVGSQIVTGKVSDSIHSFQSETYGGLFTINVKDVTVKPTAATVTYGDTLGTPSYTEPGIITGTPALTDGKAVSERDAYINLDVLNGYEILVAGRENENYNVKYVTDQDAPDVEVTAKDLTISTGTLNSDGRTSGYLKDNDQFYMNEGFAITGTTFNLLPNDRMYGEFNPVMDYTFAGFVSGDSEADLVTLLPWLVKYSDGTYHNINGNANVAFDKTNHLNGFRATSFMSGMSAYPIDSMLLANSVKNYTLASTEATQNIYQRPVTLKLREGLTKLTAYKPEILGSSGSVTTEGKAKLLELLLNNLVVDKYNGEGGLAELLKHTIEDLNIQIDTISVSAGKLTLTLKLGNQNYWLDSASSTIEIELVSTKIVPVYSPLDWTSFTVTMYNETKTTPVAISGNVRFFIFQKKDGVELKYSNYKNDTIIRSGLMDPTGRTGEFRATFSRLPAGDYAIFAIAENYTIVE